MTIAAVQYELVIGVDTHAATHTLALVTATGAFVDRAVFPTQRNRAGTRTRVGAPPSRGPRCAGFAIPQMWSGIIVLGLIGVILSLIFRAVEHRALA